METAGVFVPGSFEVQAPKFADVSTRDIAARTLRMGFTAGIQNAIVKTDVKWRRHPLRSPHNGNL